ncbi:hypothetical protein V1264_015593 [Littorina saxatilis]|uniref:Globin n=1 Tax=Littorina saxatilis TaxID=31220 RepID=A0AAN9BKB2_9CAEN
MNSKADIVKGTHSTESISLKIKRTASSRANKTGWKTGAACVTAITGGQDKRQKVTIWPEWNDADVNAEKWDAAHKGKEDKKGKSPTVQQHFFEDPDGKLELPSSLRVDHWKRPQDFITENTPVVVDTENMANDFDLISSNEHLHESELVRFTISQVSTLWELCTNKNVPDNPEGSMVEDPLHTWRPWEHIYSLCKVAKHHVPLYNPHGKYIVKLYWMGCWRKILVDDLLPFDENNQLLLPATTLSHELWPMLLTKAIIKVASLDYSGGNPGMEFGDITIIHSLTGWLPEAIPLHTPPSYTASQVLEKYYEMVATNKAAVPGYDSMRQGHLHEVWELLKVMLPQWQLPEPELEKTSLDLASESAKKEGLNFAAAESSKEEKVEAAPAKDAKPDGKEKGKDGGKDKAGKDKDKGKFKRKESRIRKGSSFKGKEKGKEDKKDKKDKDKDKNKEKCIAEETVVPEKPEVVIFAMFGSTAKYPVKVSKLGEEADASERLRQNGLSHIYPHPVCITQTRSCPLEPPPPPEIIPAWKLIRPRKKKEPPTDEPKVEPEPPKDIACIEISSPFVNYKVSPVPIPTDTCRPRSSLERGSTRSRPTTGNVGAIEETDENAPEPEAIKVERPPPADVLTLDEQGKELAEEDGLADLKGKGAFAKQRKSTARRDKSIDAGEASERRAGKTGSAKSERSKSGKKSVTKREDFEEKKEKTKDKGESRTAVAASGEMHGAHTSLGFPPIDNNASLLAELGEEGEEVDPELMALQGEMGKPETPMQRKRWMDFDQFCVCFRTLYIFHKPRTYLCNQRHSDLRNVSPSSTAAPAKGDKKPAAIAPGLLIPSDSSPGPEDKASYFLFVDNLNPTEIVISYSVLPRWFDPPTIVEEKKGGKGKDKDKDKESEKEPTAVSSISVIEGSIGREHAPPPPVTPGTLVAEPYSWKSLVTGQPILRLRTTGTRAAVLSLPAGRHVLRFMMTAPLGYHVHMCSTVNFVFGDEETVMPQLTHESCRFRDNALQVVHSLGKCIAGFTDAEQFAQACQQLVAYHCPYVNNKLLSKQKHFKLFNEALYNMLRKALRDIASPEIALAWRAFNFDVTYPNILSLQLGSRPETSSTELAQDTAKPTGSASTRGSAKPGNKKLGEKVLEIKEPCEPEKTENIWATRYMEPTPEEHVAAVKIQKVWRGFWVRKVKQARTPGTEENVKAQENLQKSWAVIEPAAEENGLFLCREMFKRDADIMQYYPFYKDEWNKISYADYRGVFPDQPSNTWFVVFREIFFVKEETLAVPRLYVPIPTCMLRVIDNDTGRELPTVFQKVAPYVYKRNKKGYTFVAEARTVEQPLASGPWRMRLIGSLSPLPAPRSGEVNCNFQVKEIRDYYLPNPKDIIFRYSVKLTEEQLCSLQVSTSKADVYVRLCVLDNEEEMASATGKGHVVIPAFVFHKDPLLPGEEAAQPAPTQPEPKRSSSRTSNRGGTKGAKGKRAESAKSPDGRNSRGSQHSEVGVSDELDEKENKPHKYIVQATVLRNSWPLSESCWTFVQMLKEQEKNELKVFEEEEEEEDDDEEEVEEESQVASRQGSQEKVNEDGEENLPQDDHVSVDVPFSQEENISQNPDGPPENNEDDVAYKERPPSPVQKEKAPAAGQKGKPKGKGDKGGKDKQDNKGSRPPSQQFDITKPNWILRIVVDANIAEEIEVKKDTERADEIRAMKKAWEEAEPGRAAKALQSRLKYLSTHTIKLQPEGEEDKEKEGEASGEPAAEPEPIPPATPLSANEVNGLEPEPVLLHEPPPALTPREMLQPLDITPFVKKTLDTPLLVDETEMQRMIEERQKQIAEYKEFRKQVETWRAHDRAARNQTKIKQLDDAQALQTMVDLTREAVNVPREAFRQRYLEAGRLKQEELERQEAAIKAEQEAKSDKGRKSAKGKNSGKKKKK